MAPLLKLGFTISSCGVEESAAEETLIKGMVPVEIVIVALAAGEDPDYVDAAWTMLQCHSSLTPALRKDC